MCKIGVNIMFNRKSVALASNKKNDNHIPVIIADFSVSGIIEMNRDSIVEYGGSFLGRDNLRENCKGRLEYTLQTSQDGYLPDDIFYRAAWLWERLVMSHLFNDGNKRTALLAMLAYLGSEDIQIYIPDYLVERIQRQMINKTIEIESIARQLKKCQ